MYEYACIITNVVDGDTVDCDIDLGFDVWLRDQRIRVLGVDTPETRTRDLREKKHGYAASDRAKGLLPVGMKTTIKTSKDGRGKFGRILGDFAVESEQGTLATTLIAERLAVAYHGQSKDDIAAEHLANYAYRESLEG